VFSVFSGAESCGADAPSDGEIHTAIGPF